MGATYGKQPMPRHPWLDFHQSIGPHRPQRQIYGGIMDNAAREWFIARIRPIRLWAAVLIVNVVSKMVVLLPGFVMTTACRCPCPTTITFWANQSSGLIRLICHFRTLQPSLKSFRFYRWLNLRRPSPLREYNIRLWLLWFYVPPRSRAAIIRIIAYYVCWKS